MDKIQNHNPKLLTFDKSDRFVKLWENICKFDELKFA
jgi:hypothetical protein